MTHDLTRALLQARVTRAQTINFMTRLCLGLVLNLVLFTLSTESLFPVFLKRSYFIFLKIIFWKFFIMMSQLPSFVWEEKF